MATGIARAAAAAGGEVQLVGKVGEDPAGDAALLDLAAASVGHVAILRDPSRSTPVAVAADGEDAPFDEPDTDVTSSAAHRADRPTSGLSLDAADIELALRYLPDYRVLVVADALAEPSQRVAVAAAGWNGAALIVVVAAGADQSTPPDGATVLEAPSADPDDAFAGVVGAYAAALDRGEEPAEAFATASSSEGVSAVAE
jgi:hypothetical protein